MLEQPAQNKMMTTTPAKKEFHFAATSAYYAEAILAETVEEAEAIYHKVKRLIAPIAPAGLPTSDLGQTPSGPAAPLSTPAPDAPAAE